MLQESWINYSYLGSRVTRNKSLDGCHTGKVSRTFSKLRERFWSNNVLSTELKMCIYLHFMYAQNSVVLSLCLRSVLGESWEGKVLSTNSIELTGMSDMYTLLQAQRLWCTGHVCRWEDTRLPKNIGYSVLKLLTLLIQLGVQRCTKTRSFCSWHSNIFMEGSDTRLV